MCGRYLINENDAKEIEKILMEINERYKNSDKLMAFKTGEICPSAVAPVLVKQDNKYILELMKWGFSRWDNKGLIINARSETALEKKMFSDSIKSRRCIVISTGFFEWSRPVNGKKIKYLFNEPKSKMLYMAGFYKKLDNEEHFVILTAEANKYMKEIHNRMPVILAKEDLKRYLSDFDSQRELFIQENVVLDKVSV